MMISCDAGVAGRRLKDFKAYVGTDGGDAGRDAVARLKEDVVEFSKSFPVVGFSPEEMEYP